MSLKLWLLSQDYNTDYDTFDSCVVAAENEHLAKLIPPNFQGMKPLEIPKPGTSDWPVYAWADPDKVTARLIGVAIDGTDTGCVIASFNAG